MVFDVVGDDDYNDDHENEYDPSVEVASRLVRIVIELLFVMEPRPQCHRWLRSGTISDFTLIKSRRRYSMRLRNFKRRRLPIRSCWGGEEEVNYFGPRGKLYFRPNLDQHLDEEGGCLLFWWWIAFIIYMLSAAKSENWLDNFMILFESLCELPTSLMRILFDCLKLASKNSTASQNLAFALKSSSLKMLKITLHFIVLNLETKFREIVYFSIYDFDILNKIT